MNKVTYKHILIVEDDDGLRSSLEKYFSENNEVTACPDVKSAISAVKERAYDVVLLDLILPDGNGLKLMEYTGRTPVVILSDLDSDGNILEGISAGAADYIVKPSSPQVIEARMSLRLLPDDRARICLHGLELNVSKRTATYKTQPLDLTSSEFNILAFLMQNAGRYFTATKIYESVWKMPYLNTTTIKAHLSNLRKKMLAVSKECAALIATDFGKGYSFTGNGDE